MQWKKLKVKVKNLPIEYNNNNKITKIFIVFFYWFSTSLTKKSLVFILYKIWNCAKKIANFLRLLSSTQYYTLRYESSFLITRFHFHFHYRVFMLANWLIVIRFWIFIIFIFTLTKTWSVIFSFQTFNSHFSYSSFHQ